MCTLKIPGIFATFMHDVFGGFIMILNFNSKKWDNKKREEWLGENNQRKTCFI